jgi:hypothetical protein
MRPMRYLLTVLLTLGLAGSAVSGELTGQVVGVLDGDIIEGLHNDFAERL